jgi:hypothetical protein
MVSMITRLVVLETLPEADVTDPSEFVIYESSVQIDPERIQLRCLDEFVLCDRVLSADASFKRQMGVGGEEGGCSTMLWTHWNAK